MTEEFVIEIISVCTKHGYLPHNVLRDFQIRSEYDKMRKDGISCKKARETLADKYFIGVKSVEAILYTKHKTRKEISYGGES